MANWLKKLEGCLPTDPEISGQLCAPTFKFRVRGKRTAMGLETKDELRKRGVASPDRADALALTFAGNVMPRSKASMPEAYGHHAATEYDPYAS